MADIERDLERKKREHEHKKREHECEERVLKREERVLERVLELEKQEVEHLRSYLTASAPQ